MQSSGSTISADSDERKPQMSCRLHIPDGVTEQHQLGGQQDVEDRMLVVCLREM